MKTVTVSIESESAELSRRKGWIETKYWIAVPKDEHSVQYGRWIEPERIPGASVVERMGSVPAIIERDQPPVPWGTRKATKVMITIPINSLRRAQIIVMDQMEWRVHMLSYEREGKLVWYQVEYLGRLSVPFELQKEIGKWLGHDCPQCGLSDDIDIVRMPGRKDLVGIHVYHGLQQ